MVIATLNGTVETTVLVLISFPVERSTLQWSWAWWMALTGDDSSRSPWKSLRIARANDVVPSDILYFIVASSSSFSSKFINENVWRTSKKRCLISGCPKERRYLLVNITTLCIGKFIKLVCSFGDAHLIGL